MRKPISPDEVMKIKKLSIPDEVIEEFDKIITRKWNGYQASFKQEEIVNIICKKLNIADSVVYQNHWLDVEDLYRDAGWDISYDKPGFNEDYEAYFVFQRKGKS